MQTIDRDHDVRCGRGFALVTIITIAAGVLLAGVQPASAQVGDACTVNGQPGVFVCPPGSTQIGGACEAAGVPVLPICQATGSQTQTKQNTVISTKVTGAIGTVLSTTSNLIAANVNPYSSGSNKDFQIRSVLSALPKTPPVAQIGGGLGTGLLGPGVVGGTGVFGTFRDDYDYLRYLTNQRVPAGLNKEQRSLWEHSHRLRIQNVYLDIEIKQLDKQINQLKNQLQSLYGQIRLSIIRRITNQITLLQYQKSSKYNEKIRNEKIAESNDRKMRVIAAGGEEKYAQMEAAMKQLEAALLSMLSQPFPKPQLPSWAQTPQRLGMELGPARFDIFAIGEGAVANSDGFAVKDVAGLVKPGALTPSSRSKVLGVGIKGSIDLARGLNFDGDQTLLANGFVSYSRVESKSGSTAELAALGLINTSSADADNGMVGGDVRYGYKGMYVQAGGAYGFGKLKTTNTIDDSRGSFNVHSYGVDVRLGKIFPLAWGLLGSTVEPRFGAKELPPPAGAYVIGLDLSGHVGHTGIRTNEFIDSTGLAVGASETRYETVGGRAELFSTLVYENVLWSPFVAIKVDQRFDFSSKATMPVQPQLPSGDVYYFSPANTFWGPEVGLTIAGQQWWSVQARGFYLASADANVAGGSVQLRIPFNP